MSVADDQSLKELISEFANKLGIEFLGSVQLGVQSDIAYFNSWIDRKKHADMKFLENYVELREDPRKLIEGGATALVFGMPYYLGYKHGKTLYKSPQIAQYARLKDYHKLLKKS